MSLKDKIMNIATAHPKLVTFGIGLAITFVMGTAIGLIDHNQGFAAAKKTGLFCFSDDTLAPTCYDTKSHCESGKQFAEATGGQMTDCKHFQ
jgi:hypothetical protein